MTTALQHDPVSARAALAEAIQPGDDQADPGQPLSLAQRARAEIAKAAANLVAVVDLDGLRTVSAVDLISVAQYIETGDDPWKLTDA